MFRFLSFCILALFLAGCAITPKFTVTTNENDKFADKSVLEVHSYNNRLSDKSICGGTHIDEQGLYIGNIAYIKDNKIIRNSIVASYSANAQAGGWIQGMSGCYKQGFQPILKVIFIADGKNITVNLTPGKSDLHFTNYNNISGGFGGQFFEASIGDLPFSDLELIANANVLDIKVVGGTNSQVFEQHELEKTFKTNLKTFIADVKNRL